MNDDDRTSLAEDLLYDRNVERLIYHASAWRAAEMHGAHVEFERLRAIGAPAQFIGPPPISPFYLFARRRELRAGSAAGTLLRIMSDPDFCSVLLRKCAWLTPATLKMLAEKSLQADLAKPFVQEIARQGILNSDSMIAKETSYTGFGSVPVLSGRLFSDWFILSQYDPLDHLAFNMPKGPLEGIVARLNGASKMMLQTAIRGGDYWPDDYMQRVRSDYKNLCHQWSYTRPKALPVEYVVTLHGGIQQL